MPKKRQVPSAKRDRQVVSRGDWWNIRAAGQTEDTAEIYIYGNIGESWWESSISADQFVKDLAAVDAEFLNVHIASYGGSVSDGLAIYNVLRRHPAAVAVYIDSVAVSIASLIAMAGDTVEIADNARMMIHAPWSYAVGNARDMRIAADVLDGYAQSMVASYRRSGQSDAELLDLLTDGEDHWYGATEAVEAGFADSIFEGLPAAASGMFYQLQSSRFARPRSLGESPIHRPEETNVPTKTKSEGDRKGPENQPPVAQGVAPAPDHPESHTPATPDNVVTLDAEKLKARNREIRQAFASFAARPGVSELEASCLANVTMSADQARAALLQHLGADSSPANPGNYAPAITHVMSDAENVRAGMRQALLARSGLERPDPQNHYRGMRLHEMTRASLERVGMNTRGMTAMELAEAALRMTPPRGAQTTSDFPVLLEDVIHKMVIAGYMAVPNTYSRFCKIGELSDFREHKRLRVGVIGNLLGVNEAGEYRQLNIPDAEWEKILATRNGGIVTITPEVIVNDDLATISSIADTFGRSGLRTVETAVYSMINANPVMSDGKALFHADHKNLADSGAVPGVSSLEAGRVGMAKQTDVSGNEYLDIRPAIGLVPTHQGGSMRVTVNAQYDPDTANKLQKPNMVNGLVSDIVDSPRLSGNAWYLFADPMVAPVIEVGFLDGDSQPRLTQEENFRTSGLSWKVELPFGVAAVDYRGAWKNPGA